MGSGPRSPQRRLALALVGVALATWGLLRLPGTHTGAASWLDDLFTAVSAVTTTGLTTVPVAPTYSFLGEALILLAIQLGGLGYVGFVSYAALRGGGRVGPRDAAVIRDEQDLDDDADVGAFARRVLAFTFGCEAVGAILLGIGFWRAGYPAGEAVWKGVFHSVSAFCTAGFALQPDSLRPFAGEPLIVGTAIALAVLGALGFLLFTAVHRRLFAGGTEDADSRYVLAMFAVTWLGFAVATYLGSPQVSATDYPLLNAAFLATTSLTGTGFSTVATGALPVALAMALVIPMSLGASPAGTSGGMKLSNVALLGALIRERLRGRGEVRFGGETADPLDVHEAVGVVALYLGLLTAGALALAVSAELTFDALLFEAASALGNVGLSRGITGELDAGAQGILMTLMLGGRIGLMTLAYALLSSAEEAN